MKKINFFISYFFIIILISLIPLYYNKSFSSKKLNLIEQKNTKNISRSLKDDDKDIGKYIIKDYYNKNKYKEYPYNGKEIENLNSQINNITSLIDQQQVEIKKKQIYLVLLGILSLILLIIIIIYSSIKCYILCSSKRDNETDYLISKLSLNKFGQVYIGENGEEKFKDSINYNSNNYGAPIYSNNNININQYNTFNPDNYIPSEEDKKLYKPYNNEDIK